MLLKEGMIVKILKPSEYDYNDEYYSQYNDIPDYFNEDGLMNDLIGQECKIKRICDDGIHVYKRDTDPEWVERWWIKTGHFKIIGNRRFY